jgi:SAM-dependent methyltransferase
MVQRSKLKSFDRVAAIYDETRAVPPAVSAAVTAALLAALRRIAREPRLLEVGIGTGRIAVPLAAAGIRVTGIDISPEMLGVLLGKRADIDVMLAEAAHPPLREASFDAALFVHILHLVPDAEATLEATLPLVRRGGALIRLLDDHNEEGHHVKAGELMWDVITDVTGIPQPPEVHADAMRKFGRFAESHGLVCEETIVTRYEAPFNARAAMDHLRRRDFSSSWLIPDTAFEEVCGRLEQRYRDEWGELDLDRPAEKTVTLSVAWLP